MTPTCTVIMPIIDRLETMAVSMSHALKICPRNVEFIIACSGATQEVKALARSFADSDPRVTALECAASPIAPATNTAREEAIHRARSDKILILQDDDVWLEDHVPTICGLLDDSDFANSSTLAATPSGALAHWPCAFSQAAYRQHYRHHTGSKAIYEAHYGFRKSAYFRFGVAWRARTKPGMSRHLIDAFMAAGEDLRWRSVARPTAISLNSPPRRLRSNATRAAELRRWIDRVTSDSGLALMRASNYTAFLARYLMIRMPALGEELEDYLQTVGLSLARDAGTHAVSIDTDSRQVADMRTLYEACAGHCHDPARLARILLPLVDPYESVDPNFWFVDGVLRKKLQREEILAEAFATALQDESDPERVALLRLTECTVALSDGKVEKAAQLWRDSEDTFGQLRLIAPALGARVAMASNEPHRAVDILQPFVDFHHPTAEHFALYAMARASAGLGDAPDIVERGIRLYPDDTSLQNLLRASLTLPGDDPATPFDCAFRIENGELGERILSSTGTVYRIEQDRIQGHLDWLNASSEAIGIIRGWAVEPCRRQPAQTIAVFVDDRFRGYGAGGLSRPDVAQALDAASAQYAGFDFHFRRGTAAGAKELPRVFVLSSDGCAAELRFSAN